MCLYMLLAILGDLEGEEIVARLESKMKKEVWAPCQSYPSRLVDVSLSLPRLHTALLLIILSVFLKVNFMDRTSLSQKPPHYGPFFSI